MVHGTLVHELHDDEDVFVPIVETFAVDERIALQMPLQTGFKHDCSQRLRIRILNPFHSILLVITASTHQEHCAAAARTELLDAFKVATRICL